MSRVWPVEMRPLGLAACGATSWRIRGHLRVTAIVKATFSFVPDGPMEVVEPDDLHADDVPFAGDPWSPGGPRPSMVGGQTDRAHSLWAASDLAPHRPEADVVLVGHAHLPRGGGAVRLVVWRDGALVDKSIHVADEGGDGAPIPLVYERAYGGPRSAENPVGTGRVKGSRLPDLIDPARLRHPIGFGPIAPWWPVRAALLGGADPRTLAQPIAEVPNDIDWAYFQAAPLGQRTGYLHGDEWIRLEGMNAEHPVLQTRLPGVRAAARVYGLVESDAVPIDLLADTLHIDADRGRCSLTFRASFAVPSEEVLPQLVVLAGVELPDYPILWPEAEAPPAIVDEETAQLSGDAEPVALDPDPPPAQPRGRQATVLLEWGDGGAPPPVPMGEATPFPPAQPAPPPRRQSTTVLEWPAGAAPVAPRARQTTEVLAWPVTMGGDPPYPPAQPAGAAPVAPRGRQATTVLEWPAQGEVPITLAPAPPAPPVTSVDDDDDDDSPLMRTMVVSDDQQAAAPSLRAPFHIAAPGTAPAASAAIPGAPWSENAAEPMISEPLPPPERELVPPPLPAPDPPPVEIAADPWAPAPPPAAAPPPAPAKPRPAPVARPAAAQIKRGIYGRFDNNR